jgi:phosphoglycolate phosphatase-like HAD superfamily hydrolase
MASTDARLLDSSAVVFDVDGTLVDTVDFHAEAWQKAFAAFGHTFDFQAIRSQIGKGGDQLMPVFLPPDVLKRQGQAIEAYRKDVFARDYMPRVRGFPKVPDLFRFLLDAGVRVALGSSAKGDELDAYKKAAGMATVALLCGGFPEPDLRGAGAVGVRRDPADLLKSLRQSRTS